ncbi:hypothetical protein ACFL03_01350 [Thermodesulfobacteriota bacterium]
MKKIITFFTVFAVVAFIPLAAVAANKTIEAQGESMSSKEDALRQAMRLAVEQAVGVFVHSETEVENFELKKDKILSRTQGYVTSYTVLKEEKVDDVIKVVIRATISLDKIKDDLLAMKILLDSMERPKVMILIKEKLLSADKAGGKIAESAKDEMEMRIAETEMSSLLVSKGFDLVDKAQLEAVKNLDQRRQALAGNTVAAKSLGLSLGAQYVILGKAVAQDSGEAYPGTGLRSIQASLQTKIIQTQTGLVLGSVVKSGVAAHISPLTGATKALQEAVHKAVDQYLVNAITASFQDYLNNGAPMKLQVTGVNSFRQYKQIVSGIDALDNVVSSKKEGWNKAGGLLVLDMRFKGTSEELAELLDGIQLGENSLEVVDFAPERVDCNFK